MKKADVYEEAMSECDRCIEHYHGCKFESEHTYEIDCPLFNVLHKLGVGYEK